MLPTDYLTTAKLWSVYRLYRCFSDNHYFPGQTFPGQVIL